MQTYFTPSRKTAPSLQCRHILTDGRRCSSPCLRHEEFCYYHHTTRRPIENPAQRKARLGTFDMSQPEDRSAIQFAIGEILQRIASNDLDPRRAGLLLYGLQIASLNLPKPTADTTHLIVEDTTEHPAFGTLAPTAEMGSLEPKGSATLLLEELRDQERQDLQREREALKRDRAQLAAERADFEAQRAELGAPGLASETQERTLGDPEAEPVELTVPTLQATAASDSANLFPTPYSLLPASQRQVLVNKRDRHAALTDTTRNPLDRLRPHITRAEHTRQARLQRKRRS